MKRKELIEAALEGPGLKKNLSVDELLHEQKKMLEKMREIRKVFKYGKEDDLEELLINKDSKIPESTNIRRCLKIIFGQF